MKILNTKFTNISEGRVTHKLIIIELSISQWFPCPHLEFYLWTTTLLNLVIGVNLAAVIKYYYMFTRMLRCEVSVVSDISARVVALNLGGWFSPTSYRALPGRKPSDSPLLLSPLGLALCVSVRACVRACMSESVRACL